MALVGLLGACKTLPSSAPTIGQVQHSAARSQGTLNYRIVPIDANLTAGALQATEARNDADLVPLEALALYGTPGRTDTIRVGDTLSVRIFEVGVSLFSSQPQSAQPENPIANGQTFQVLVQEDGTVKFPYAGTLKAAGTTPDTLERAIRDRLRPLSESPEASVTIADSVGNTAYVSGTVARTGRYRLTSARERLLDVLALAGGPAIDPAAARLHVVRGDKVADVALDHVRPESLANIVVLPGDRIELLRRRDSYTVFGATGRVSQVPFDGGPVSLAEAIARAGGPADSLANARGVFVFRFERDKAAGTVAPVIYQLNLLKADSYFLSQLFRMQDKDVILFANADANLPGKLINMLNQLVSPAVTAKVLTQ